MSTHTYGAWEHFAFFVGGLPMLLFSSFGLTPEKSATSFEKFFFFVIFTVR